ncbi:MAG TPA: hypothetical protein VGN57_15180 [Pirellulaceae bacterium]|jgi:hypothetical protein|nr:hypothetical protein [Pirellulaceae bacterium]
MNSAPAPIEPNWGTKAIVVGVVFAIGAAIAITGVWAFAGQLLVQIGSAVAGLIVTGTALAMALSRRPLSESQIEQGREELDRERRDVGRQERQIRKQLEAWTSRLEKREKQLAERLMTYHEWTEFPLPDADAAVLVEDPLALAKDAELERLLEEESRMLLDKLTANYFAPAGTIDAHLVREDFSRFLQRVVHVYQPDAKEPLLETSVAHLCRATSRISLHLLVLLDQLPVNLKDANLSQLYAWARRAAQAYRAYRSAEPYFPAMTGAWYVGRMAMGANPVSLAVWWGIGELGKRGAVKIASQLLQQQALLWLDQSLRIVAHEAAAVYGTDFRYRDPDWLYATELSETVHLFPESVRATRNAFREISALPLRSEYDRFFLLRAIAEKKSAKPERYVRAISLDEGDKRRMLARLEEFVHRSYDELPLTSVRSWKETLEGRYGMAVRLRQDRSFGSTREQAIATARFLANFLKTDKGAPDEAIAKFLAAPTRACRAAAPEAFDGAVQTFGEDASADASEPAWEFPLLDPDGPLASAFVDDYASAAFELPYRPDDELRVEDAAENFKVPPVKVKRRLRKLRGERLSLLGEAAATLAAAPDEVQRLALALLTGGEALLWAYGPVERIVAAEDREETRPGWLLGASRQWMWISNDGTPLVWPFERRHEVVLERERFTLREDLTIMIPAFEEEGLPPATFRVVGSRWRRAAVFFAPLIEYFVGDKDYEETLPEGDIVLDEQAPE